jgi:hypothetical protein
MHRSAKTDSLPVRGAGYEPRIEAIANIILELKRAAQIDLDLFGPESLRGKIVVQALPTRKFQRNSITSPRTSPFLGPTYIYYDFEFELLLYRPSPYRARLLPKRPIIYTREEERRARRYFRRIRGRERVFE